MHEQWRGQGSGAMEDVGLEAMACGSDHLKATKCEGVIPCGLLNPDSLHTHEGGLVPAEGLMLH